MKNLKKYIYETWSNSLASIDKKIIHDIYAFSFYVYNDEDDPRCPTLTIGYNTNSNFQKEMDNAASQEEAKWNYAYWLQNEISTIGNEDDDDGKSIISNWILEEGLNYSDQEKEEDYDICFKKGEKITEEFIEILIEIIRTSHTHKMTTKPILIHELEYYDKIRDQNIAANGQERVIEFSNWIHKM